MPNIFSRYVDDCGITTAKLDTIFDATRDAPKQIQELSRTVPQIMQVMDGLREYLPIMRNAGVGPQCDGDFYRLPNHYRSVSFLLPPADGGDEDVIPGAIVFKGTEPLLPDFENYYDWMLSAPFRASFLPLGLHFPLDMKIPPAAMWIRESIAEQVVATGVQNRFLEEYGRFGRLPVPLYVFKYTDEQIGRYSQVIRTRISEAAFRKFSNKLEDGLGVEVYYYPSVPVRVGDLLSGGIKEAFGASLSHEEVESTVGKWTLLIAELLQLRYMPFVPWHSGLGSCVDYGNACLDGGFNDLLTLSSFDAIPSSALMRRSLSATVRVFADTIVSYCNTAAGGRGIVSQDSAALSSAQLLVMGQIREHLRAMKVQGRHIDERLMEFLEQPSTADIVTLLSEERLYRDRKPQYLPDMPREVAED